MTKITLITDGSCVSQGSVNPGGWAAILRFGEHEKVLTGNAVGTTSQRMEATAVIEGLKALKQPCEVTVKTDSQYVCGVLGGNKIVANRDLWTNYFQVVREGGHKVSCLWVKGHAGNPDNERVDKLAKQACDLVCANEKTSIIPHKKPSEIPCNHSGRGYYDSVKEGWYNLDDCTISGNGFTVKFSAAASRRIDEMCDALNGWYAIWSKWHMEYKDAHGVIDIYVTDAKNADKIFDCVIAKMNNSDKKDQFCEEWTSTCDSVRVGLQTLHDFLN